MAVADTANNNNALEISEEEVALFLKNHPDFFLSRDELLCEIELTHPSGGAVSLLERQVSLLRERNMDMRGRLNNLLDNARNNDRLFEKTKGLVLKLLEADQLDAAVTSCINGLLTDFSMDFANLTLFGDPAAHESKATRFVSLDNAMAEIPGLLKSNNATCGVLRPKELQFLFPHNSEQIGSAAVVPLSYAGMTGVLAIGSRDQQYFRSSMGTLFLGYIAEVLNRTLPSLLKG
jgi:uncharacterized protein YigA (DUF484 family)